MHIKFYPEFKIWLKLEELFNIDLFHRACYAIKIRFPDNIKDNISITHIVKDSLLTDDVVIEGEVNEKNEAISRFKAILYKKECVTLNDVFLITYKLPKSVIQSLKSLKINFEIQLLTRPRQPDSSIPILSGDPKILSTRKLCLNVKIDKSIHLKKVIYFNSNSFAAISLTLYASLIGFKLKKKSYKLELTISNQMKHIYEIILYGLLSSYHDLKNFIYRNANVLNGIVLNNEESVNIKEEIKNEINILNEHDNPWEKIEESISIKSKNLNTLFEQVIFLFKNCKQITEQLYQKEFLNRMKKLGEGFFYWEDSIISLIDDSSNHQKAHEIIIKKIEKSDYWRNIPMLDLHCEENDHLYPKGSVVLEHSFSPLPRRKDCVTISPSSSKLEENLLSTDTIDSSKIVLEKDTEIKKYTKYSNNEYSVDKVDLKIKKINSITKEKDEIIKKVESSENSSLESSSSSSSEHIEMITEMLDEIGKSDKNIVAYIAEKEKLKAIFLNLNFQCMLYSEKNSLSTKIVDYFSPDENIQHDIRFKREQSPLHLVVLVHGLEGSSLDLQGYMNFISLSNPDCNYQFLHSQCNESKTWLDIESMGKNLLNEIFETLDKMKNKPVKISFVAHSLGGLIIRSMFNITRVDTLIPYLHTFLTLNSPHCGLMYMDKKTSLGINIIKWWKQSMSLYQLTLRDNTNPRESFIYKLSLNSAFSYFQNVLLVGDYNDNFVPATSSLVEMCAESKKDNSIMGYTYREIIQNINNTIIESKNNTFLIKYIISHRSDPVMSVDRFIGRSEHVAPVDDDNFIEKFTCISAGKYFR
ncbi:Domain of unknown function DUF676, lipase-like domain-containing protein [Strongyloides ratti]|uniref:DUF676 domain-containing protein n=1 Tax=Strongyloides ratti TaxID=34506 RepID=A0A090LIT4_STRRB|nr:Domain of unknown function DUF676, lipase-like domain-containing protein [Strongyloides ratti]CEF68048.1 Domain of unknown function DUF676, lipase-like domain-containing protein [Strongyloides ratti]